MLHNSSLIVLLVFRKSLSQNQDYSKYFSSILKHLINKYSHIQAYFWLVLYDGGSTIRPRRTKINMIETHSCRKYFKDIQYMFTKGVETNQTSMETNSYFICVLPTELDDHFSHFPSASSFLSICFLLVQVSTVTKAEWCICSNCQCLAAAIVFGILLSSLLP